VSDERLLATFLDLVRIPTAPFAEAECARYCADALRQCGARVDFDDTRAVTGSETGNLIAWIPGTAAGMSVGLSAHMDTVGGLVQVEPVVGEDGVVRSAGDTILGADDKAGIAAIIETVRRITERGEAHAGIQVLLSVAEEVGLVGAKAMSPEVVQADLILVLDAVGPVGGIVTAAPTHYTFRAEFHGKASHAGVEPENGVSALVMASRAVASMELGRLDEMTTANVGSIAGGVATNVVAAEAAMTGECRSRDVARVEEVRESMEDVMRTAAAGMGGTVDVEWQAEYRAYRVADDSAEYRLVVGAMADIGVEPRPFETGGGADSNIFAAAGVPVVALSGGMNDVHGPGEYIAVADIELMVALLEAVVARALDLEPRYREER
jgi:tripeptide aminopeptidase